MSRWVKTVGACLGCKPVGACECSRSRKWYTCGVGTWKLNDSMFKCFFPCSV